MIILQNLPKLNENSEHKWKGKEYGLIKDKMSKENPKLISQEICGMKEEKKQHYISKEK